MQRPVKFRSRGILHTARARPAANRLYLRGACALFQGANEIGMATRGEGWDTSSLRVTSVQACV